MLDGRMVMQIDKYYCIALQVPCPAEIVDGKQQVGPILADQTVHPVTVHTIVRMV